MTRWHDIEKFEVIDDDANSQYGGLDDSINIVKALIQHEIDAGIAVRNPRD